MSILLDIWFLLPGPLKWIAMAIGAYIVASSLLGSFALTLLLLAALVGLLFLGLSAKAGTLALGGMLGKVAQHLTGPSILPVPSHAPASQNQAAGAHAASPQVPAPQSSPAPSMTRPKALQLGTDAINTLHGNDTAKRLLSDLVAVAEAASKRGETGLGLTAQLHLVLLHGPSGTGKSQVVQALPALLYGVGALSEYRAQILHGREVRDAGAGGASELAERRALASLGGVLILEDAEWLAGIASHAGSDFAVEVGRSLIGVAEAYPGLLTIIATGRSDIRNKLIENRLLQSAWINKIDTSDIEFEDLSTEDLIAVFRDLLLSANAELPSELLPLVRQLIEARRKAEGDLFSNAYAVKRILDGALKRAKIRTEGRGTNLLLLREDFHSSGQ